MTEIQIEQFRKEFKHLVWLKGELSEADQKIIKLTRFDVNGSHSNAIRKAIDEKNKIMQDFTGKLKNHTYNEWRDFSKRLSQFRYKLKPAEERYSKVMAEGNALYFNL